MGVVRKIAVLAIGFVFFIAGFLKLVDPVGTGLIVTDYFRFFHLAFLRFAAMPVAVGLALFETILGAALLTGVWPKKTSLACAATLAVFTVITFILWIANPAMDCGCFGEAIHLTHAQSLIKNLILDGLWCLAFLPLGSAPAPSKMKYVGFGVAALSVLGFCVFSLISLPLADHTPFRNGTELGSGDSDLTAQLSITDPEGEYADSILQEGNVVVVSIYHPKMKVLKKAVSYVQEIAGTDARVVVLVSGDPDEIFETVPSIAAVTYLADRRTLMTLNRSNGGVTYLSNGQVVTKWSSAFRPGADELVELYGVSPITAGIKENTADRNWLQGFLLYVFAVMLLL